MIGPERGPGPRERRADEAYQAGREEGFDRGFDEGFAAARHELAGRRIPALPAAPATAPPTEGAKSASRRVSGARIAGVGVLVALAWWFLRTWPGRVVLVVLVFALLPLIQLGAWAGTLVVGAFLLAWAVRTGRRAVADTKSGIRQTRAIARTVSQRQRL